MPTSNAFLTNGSGSGNIVKHILSGTNLTSAQDGFTYVERMLATGMTGDNPLYAASQLSDIPRRNEAHPTIPHLYVTDVKYSYADNDKENIWVDLVYKRPTRSGNRTPSDTAKPSIEITTTLVTETTNYDNTGSAIEVFRQNLNDPSKPSVQPVPVQIQIPQLTVRLTRKEPSHPLFKGIMYSGHVNKSAFLGGDVRTWLCAGIDARSVDAGESYECTYNFIYKERDGQKKKGWDITCFYTSNGLPIPTNADPAPMEGFEFGTFEVYPEAEFSDLNIDIGGGSGANYIGGGIVGV